MKVLLSGPVGVPTVNVLDGEGAGTIVDKNAPPSALDQRHARARGGGATFTVTLAGTTLRTVTVRFNTADGTAKAGSDYAAPHRHAHVRAGREVEDDRRLDRRRHGGRARRGVLRRDRRRRQRDDHEEPRRGIDRGQRPPGRAADDRSDSTKPPVAKPASVLVPRMILGPRTVSIGANGMARMLVTCQKLSPIGCAGSVELERATKPLLKLGKKTFTVKKGAKGYASIKLNLKTLKLLQKNGTMRAKVIVLVKTSTKTMKVSPGDDHAEGDAGAQERQAQAAGAVDEGHRRPVRPRAAPLQFRGRSPVAQLAEHSAVNRRVVGSSPTRGAQGRAAMRKPHGYAGQA